MILGSSSIHPMEVSLLLKLRSYFLVTLFRCVSLKFGHLIIQAPHMFLLN